MNGDFLSYRWWKLRRALAPYFRHPVRSARGLLFGAVALYLSHFWWQHSPAPKHITQWLHRQLPHAASVFTERDSSYRHTFDLGLQKLRADRQVRLMRYDFPLAALRYQQTTAGSWRLQSRRALLVGIAVPRAYRGVLDDHGIVFIDPHIAPPEALANINTPLPLAVLQRDFLLVPDLTGERRTAYQIVPWRQLSTKR